MNTFESTVNTFTETLIKRSKQKAAQYMDAFDKGDQYSLTVDNLGRFHADRDGYDHDLNDVYLKGQFVPSPFDNDADYFFTVPKKLKFETRCQVSGSILTELKLAQNLQGVSVTFGKTFKKSGVDTCYAYFRAASKGYLKLINNYLDTAKSVIEEEMKAVQEKTNYSKGTAPQGKQNIKGVVLGLPSYESPYGYQQLDHKIMVELENGSTVYGTLPKALYQVEIGDAVEFSANFEHSKEPTHAYFKRPTKATFTKK